MQKEKKHSVVSFLLLVLFIAGTVAAYIFDGFLFGEGSFFNRPVSGNQILQTLFGKIPLLIRSVQVITIAVTVKLALDLLMHLLVRRGNRRITVIKLLSSFLKWIIGIVAVLIVLSVWGVDTAAIIASAGILSLVVGLGAQSLVADIIAGLFIVIEGEYQVGDIVVIDNWRGTVTEIGIRTTKIQDAGGNVMIINNSEITTIVNQTQSLSVAKVTVAIEYEESLPRVELILKENLEQISTRISGIIEGPFYKGVTALAASGVELLFVAECREEDIFQVQRELNRELKLLFDENGVNIPFQQVVVHQPTPRSPEAPANETAARAFAEEQQARSKHLEETREQDE